MFPFQKIVLFIINLIRKSLQIELLNFTKIDNVKEASKQAFSKARRKLDPVVFLIINNQLIQEFYTDNEIKTFHNFRILSIDGSQIQLPSSNEIIDYYGVAQNQNGQVPMAQASTLFDVLNKVTIDALITPYRTSERNLAIEHIDNLVAINKNTNFAANNIKDLFLFDRGYPSIELIMKLDENKKDFIMRCPITSLGVVQQVLKKGERNQIVDIKFADLANSTKERLKKKIEKFNESTIIKARVLIFTLKSGELEILLTSLLNEEEYPSIELFNLYHRRWDIEENYKFYKLIAEMENFSGKSRITVEQDFFATIFTCNIASLLMQEAQDEIDESLKHKEYKHTYKINRNLGLGLLKDELIKTILSNEKLEAFCEKVKLQMKKNIIPIRPGRSSPRPFCKGKKKKHPSNKRPGI